MPIEATMLRYAAVPLSKCPKCDAEPFVPFLRGQVQRSTRKWGLFGRQPYCALICSECHAIVAHEEP